MTRLIKCDMHREFAIILLSFVFAIFFDAYHTLSAEMRSHTFYCAPCNLICIECFCTEGICNRRFATGDDCMPNTTILCPGGISGEFVAMELCTRSCTSKDISCILVILFFTARACNFVVWYEINMSGMADSATKCCYVSCAWTESLCRCTRMTTFEWYHWRIWRLLTQPRSNRCRRCFRVGSRAASAPTRPPHAQHLIPDPSGYTCPSVESGSFEVSESGSFSNS